MKKLNTLFWFEHSCFMCSTDAFKPLTLAQRGFSKDNVSRGSGDWRRRVKCQCRWWVYVMPLHISVIHDLDFSQLFGI